MPSPSRRLPLKPTSKKQTKRLSRERLVSVSSLLRPRGVLMMRIRRRRTTSVTRSTSRASCPPKSPPTLSLLLFRPWLSRLPPKEKRLTSILLRGKLISTPLRMRPLMTYLTSSRRRSPSAPTSRRDNQQTRSSSKLLLRAS